MSRPSFRALALTVLTALLAAPFALAQSGAILLNVDGTDNAQKLLRIHESIPVSSGPLTLYYPKWIPGEHGPDGPIDNVAGLKFEAGGKVIPWTRDTLDVFTFHVDVPAGASQLDASFDFIETEGYSATDKLFVLEWNEVLFYPAGAPSSQITFDPTLTVPDGWKYGTPLPVAGEKGNKIKFKPVSLELLVDSPVITGEYYRAIDITPAGEPVHHELDLVADSEAALDISPEVQKGMVNLVAEAGKLFGTRHYRDYHFLLTLSDHVQHFGLEHHESNDSRLPERALLGPGAGMMVGTLLPHEYVHSWNGKFRRPGDLATPDFEKPMQDDLLWVYEGLTEYLGPMLGARSGLMTPEQYHEMLASDAASLGPGRPGRTWRPLQDTASAIIGEGPGGGRGGWTNWRRSSDYYPEGDLLWLEVATVIHQVTNGQKSIDDFCHLFHGGANNGQEVKGYTFDDVVATLNQIAPYDWGPFLRRHLDSTTPDIPEAGLVNSGWHVDFTDQPSHMPGRRGGPSDVYSIGLQLSEEGQVGDAIYNGPAFKAGISSGMKVVGVNGRLYNHDILEDAIKAAKGSSVPISLLVINDEFYFQANVDYHGGQRYPHLKRDDSKPDYLDELIKAHVGQ
jgi:predicted metalloprotease with PDZ domain